MISDLQRQAWESSSPGVVLEELQGSYTIQVDGDKLIVKPFPNERLCYQIKRYKTKLLELLGVGKTTAERIDEAWKARGVDPASYEAQERESIRLEMTHKGPIAFPPAEEQAGIEAPWDPPVIVREDYCRHPKADYFRVKVDGTPVVKLLCPECGHNLKGPRRFVGPRKRSDVPWWPKDSPVVPDPDAATDALVEWWFSVECNIVDGVQFSQGVVVTDAVGFKRSINELIGLWRLGDNGSGLHAQLQAHQKHLEANACTP